MISDGPFPCGAENLDDLLSAGAILFSPGQYHGETAVYSLAKIIFLY